MTRYIIDDREEYGRSIKFDYRMPLEEKLMLIQVLISWANKELPSGTVFEIIEKEHPSQRTILDFGRIRISENEASLKHGFASYSMSAMQGNGSELFFNKPFAEVDPSGKYIVARLKVGEKI